MNNNGNTGNGKCFTTATNYHLKVLTAQHKEGNIEEGCKYIIAKKIADILSEGTSQLGMKAVSSTATPIHDEACQQSSCTGFAKMTAASTSCKSTTDSPQTKGEDIKTSSADTEDNRCSKNRIHK